MCGSVHLEGCMLVCVCRGGEGSVHVRTLEYGHWIQEGCFANDYEFQVNASV